jgi:hypothetical protein
MRSWLIRFVLAVVWVYVVVTAVVPYKYGTYIAPLLALALVACVLLRVDLRPALPWVLALLAVGLMGLLVGLARDNPGARPTITIFVVEPVVIGLLLGSIWQVPGHRRAIVSALDTALVVAVVVGVTMYEVKRLGGTMPSFLVDPAYSAVDTTGTTLRTNFQGFNSLAFLAPYAMARGVAAKETTFVWRTVLVCAGVLGVVLSGRRMFYLTVPVVTVLGILCLALVLRRLLRRPISGRQVLLFLGSLGAAAVVTTAVVAIVAVTPVQAVTRTAGQVTVSSHNDVRTSESKHFLDAIEESPIWGHGSGAVVPGHIRDLDRPWTYELTYHQILFDFGLLGSIVLLGWTLWMAWRLWGRIRDGDQLVVAIAAGWAGVLLASVYDPYLLKIDGMWMVFIPFGFAVAAAQRRVSPQRQREGVAVS